MIFAFIGELIAEALGPIVSAFIGLAIGSLVWLLVRMGRRARARLDEPIRVVDPTREAWTVRVALTPTSVRYRASNRLLAMRPQDQRAREAAGHDRDDVTPHEIANPSKLLDRFDEAAGLVAVPLLLFAVAAALILALEIVIVAIIAALVYLLSTLRRRWTVEVTDPVGGRQARTVTSIDEARSLRSTTQDRIAAGLTPFPDAAPAGI